MKRQLKMIRKILLVLFWALRFRIYRVDNCLRAYLAIERAGLFDAEFYRKTLANADQDHRYPYLLVHYLARGAREGNDPHPLFNTAYYLMQSPDIKASGLNPLIHYIDYGARQSLNPNPLFDTAYY